MSVFDLVPEESRSKLDMLNNPPESSGLFTKFGEEAMLGPVRLGNKAAMLAGDIVTPPLRRLAQPIDEIFKTHIDDWLVRQQTIAHDNAKAMMSDPRAGLASRVAGSLSEVVPGVMMTGPLAVAGVEGYGTSQEMLDQGVDAGTAAGAGVVSAAANYLGMKLPPVLFPKSGYAVNALGGSAVNVATGMAQRATMSQLLSSNGYTQLAEQYKVLDSDALIVDAVLGSGFGILGKALHVEPLSNVKPSLIEEAVRSNENLHVKSDTLPGVPKDFEASDAHHKELMRSFEAHLAGDEYTASAEIQNAKFDPLPPSPVRDGMDEAIREHMGPEWQAMQDEIAKRNGLPTDLDLYARGGRAFGSTVADVVAAVRQSFGKDSAALVDSGAVRVVENASDLPPRADGQAHPADARGYFDGEHVYLVAGNLPKEDVRPTIVHEVGAHVGMEQMLGADVYAKLLADVSKRAQAGEADFAEALRRVPVDTPEGNVPAETLAYLVENRPDLPLVKRLLSQIKTAVYRLLGGRLVTLNADDLRTMAVAALRRVSRSSRNDVLSNVKESQNVRPEQAGDGTGRYSGGGLAPLDGAPQVSGATGPDARLVSVAEQYAAAAGIQLRRQSEYAKVDVDRAKRIAAAYEAMPHAPQDPVVREAYQNLIRQTFDQYKALEKAGYKFWFFNDTTDPYSGNPWNAMRDLRENQSMGVYESQAGFGSGATDIDVADNPLLADTGLRWPSGSPNGPLKPVLANDLFRAVHDAFGHGLEGAGFRAQGEENAWQAHARLFTGSALGALTSETRGQNSWLNFGPHAEANATAKVEDTVFADQKTGLMPEWTWQEGIVPDMPNVGLYARGTDERAATRQPGDVVGGDAVGAEAEGVTQGAHYSTANPTEAILYDRPNMTIPMDDGTEVPAARALADADAEIARAQQDSQGFDAAVACALRVGG